MEGIAVWKKCKESPWLTLVEWNDVFSNKVGKLIEPGYPAEFIFDEDISSKISAVFDFRNFPTAAYGKVYGKNGWQRVLVVIDMHIKSWVEYNPDDILIVTRMIVGNNKK